MIVDVNDRIDNIKIPVAAVQFCPSCHRWAAGVVN